MKLMTKRLKKLFTPDYMFPDLLQVDFQTLADQGYKLILLDIDNTLALHGASVADDYARQVIGRVQEAGLVCRLSPMRCGNGPGNMPRAGCFGARAGRETINIWDS